ncbi:MAG TPA: hypothetical protein VLM42_08655 [Bryobacteraceae bacterium]|nr:hypothetical protein [Bryobacteraceae bacterium]
MPILSQNSNIAKRPMLIFACLNIGIVAMMVWQYYQTGLPLWMCVERGLLYLIIFNGLALFRYKKATAPQADKISK